MLAVYSLGLAIPFLLTAIAFARMTTAFGFIKRHYAGIMAIGGVVLIVMGVLVFTGELTRLNLEAQQALDDLGIDFFNQVCVRLPRVVRLDGWPGRRTDRPSRGARPGARRRPAPARAPPRGRGRGR